MSWKEHRLKACKPLLKQKRATQSPLFPGKESGPKSKKGFYRMKTQVLIASAFVATLAVPLAAHAQGVPGGIAHGVYEGNRRAGPVGAVVGGAVGGVLGGIEGLLGVNYYQTSYSEPPNIERQQRPARHHKRHDDSR